MGFKGVLTDFNIFYQGAVYYWQIKDMLIPYQNDLSEEIFYRNAGRAQNTGAEFSLEWHLKQSLKLQLSYSFMDFVFSDYQVDNPLLAGEKINLKNKKVPGIAPRTFYVGLTYNLLSDLQAIIQLYSNEAYFVNDFNGPAPGEDNSQANYINNSSTSLNARIAKIFSFKPFDLHIFIGIDNLFDNRFNGSVVTNAVNNNFFEPAAGRTWYTGIKLVL